MNQKESRQELGALNISLFLTDEYYFQLLPNGYVNLGMYVCTILGKCETRGCLLFNSIEKYFSGLWMYKIQLTAPSVLSVWAFTPKFFTKLAVIYNTALEDGLKKQLCWHSC